MQQRLDKLVANSGTYSRKEAKQLIRSGRVLVNGAPAQSGDAAVSPEDAVTLDGKPLRGGHLYIMLNKPQGVVCATRDRLSPTVLELLPPDLRRKGLFPAGRLDKDTEGFVLITDDGELAHRILSPRRHLPKTYRATLDRPIPDPDGLIRHFGEGVLLEDGERCLPAELSILENRQYPQTELVIYQGKYHQIKRMFHRFSLEVTHLKRIRIGGLDLDPNLPSGGAREITYKEMGQICGK